MNAQSNKKTVFETDFFTLKNLTPICTPFGTKFIDIILHRYIKTKHWLKQINKNSSLSNLSLSLTIYLLSHCGLWVCSSWRRLDQSWPEERSHMQQVSSSCPLQLQVFHDIWSPHWFSCSMIWKAPHSQNTTLKSMRTCLHQSVTFHVWTFLVQWWVHLVADLEREAHLYHVQEGSCHLKHKKASSLDTHKISVLEGSSRWYFIAEIYHSSTFSSTQNQTIQTLVEFQKFSNNAGEYWPWQVLCNTQKSKLQQYPIGQDANGLKLAGMAPPTSRFKGLEMLLVLLEGLILY